MTEEKPREQPSAVTAEAQRLAQRPWVVRWWPLLLAAVVVLVLFVRNEQQQRAEERERKALVDFIADPVTGPIWALHSDGRLCEMLDEQLQAWGESGERMLLSSIRQTWRELDLDWTQEDVEQVRRWIAEC